MECNTRHQQKAQCRESWARFWFVSPRTHRFSTFRNTLFCTSDETVTQPLLPRACWPHQQLTETGRKEYKCSASFGTSSDWGIPGVFPDNQLFVLPLSSFSVVNNPSKRGLEQGIEVLIVICTYLHQGHFIWKLYPIISVLPSPADKNALIKHNCHYSHCSETLNVKLEGRWKTICLL